MTSTRMGEKILRSAAWFDESQFLLQLLDGRVEIMRCKYSEVRSCSVSDGSGFTDAVVKATDAPGFSVDFCVSIVLRFCSTGDWSSFQTHR